MNSGGVVFNGMIYHAPDILAAWHRRGDVAKADRLWRAACWAQAGLQRSNPERQADDFARAEDIICADPEAWFEMWIALPRLSSARRRRAANRSGWGRAKRGTWR